MGKFSENVSIKGWHQHISKFIKFHSLTYQNNPRKI